MKPTPRWGSSRLSRIRYIIYHFEKKSIHNTKSGTGSRGFCPFLDVWNPPPIDSCRKEAFEQTCRGRRNGNGVPPVFTLAHRIGRRSSDR